MKVPGNEQRVTRWLRLATPSAPLIGVLTVLLVPQAILLAAGPGAAMLSAVVAVVAYAWFLSGGGRFGPMWRGFADLAVLVINVGVVIVSAALLVRG